MFNTLIAAADLTAHAHEPDWLVIDVRHDLQDTHAGRNAYAAGHIPGAFFLELDDDLSGPKNGSNGRHPLPDRAAFARRMAQLGVNPSTQVVSYDAHGGMFAARLWWMLRWIGHEAVAVLDGGWNAWLSSGGESTKVVPPARLPGSPQLAESLTRQVTAADLMVNLETGTRLVLDARAPDRFRGENETLDPVAGHIPGARNHFFRNNLLDDGRFKPGSQLRDQFLSVQADYSAHNVVMQCGSGVTACHNLLAMEIAGLHGAALYPGSWSEWCSDPSRPISQGQT